MTASRFVLAIDEGSTGVRALLFDRQGVVRGSAYREIHASYPRPAWVEQDPERIWDATLEVVGAAASVAAATPRDLAAIGVTGQRSTAVAWHRRSGSPLHPAISWQDLRGTERSNELLAEGHFVSPLSAATKLEWMRRNSPAVRAALERDEARFGTIESWLVAKLSGGRLHVTDPSYASTTGLYEFFENRWNTPFLDVLGIPETALPELRPSSERYGDTDPEIFGAPIPLAAIAGDQQAAMFGQLRLAPGELKVSYGTSAMVDLNAGFAPLLSSHGAFPLVLWKLGEDTHYCLEGNAITAGASITWLRDGLGLISAPEESAALAASVADGGGVWMVPAFQGLGTPYLDPGARAVVGGLSRASTRAHVIRAVLEGIALRSAEVVRALAADSPTGLPAVLRVDGGAARNDFLLQFQSDVLGIPVERPETLEAAASGAAYLAGLAVGFWPDTEALGRIWRLGKRFEPRMSEDEREARFARFTKQVGVVRELSAI
ncbi:MAG: FGGY family carbohydrate kinase [Candidatus Binatia bacterium]